MPESLSSQYAVAVSLDFQCGKKPPFARTETFRYSARHVSDGLLNGWLRHLWLCRSRLEYGFAMDIKLVMFREDGSKRVFPLESRSTIIGRKDDCDIRIPLAIVSRHHAEITIEDDVATLKDLGASNGTFLNNERVEQEEVAGGDHIMIGPIVFIFQIDGDPSDDELVEIHSQISAAQAEGMHVGTSDHVSSSDDEVDPIAALEALASSADQTAINPEEEE